MAVQAIVLAPLGWLSAGHLLNWIPWAVIAGYLLRREWFLLQVNLHHVVKLNRDQDRFNKSIRDHRLSDGDAAIAVTLRYFGPRQVTIVDIGYRLYSSTFWGPSTASDRPVH